MTTIIDGSGSAEFHTALPVAEGGTGATASTGSGNVVLSASPTLTGTLGAALITSTTASGENKLTVKADAASQQASLSLQVQSGTPGQTVMYMGKVGATTNGQVGYNPTNDKMTFFTNNSEKMAIDSSGTVTLGTPLPVASGGTGNTQGGQVVRNHYINSTGSAQNLGPTSTMTAVGCTANIPVTAGNILTVWWTVGVYTNAAAHWAGTAFLDSTSLGHGQWGDGIHNGSTTLTGWQTSTGQNRIVIPTTKTASLSLRMTCNSGSITIRRDGNLGYDGAWMIVQETTP
mgnify:FL=1